MDPPPPIGCIYQLAVQEENHHLATIVHTRGGEGMSLVALSSGVGSGEIGRAHV